MGFSLDYIGFLCRYLVRKGFLNFSGGYYSLAKVGIKIHLEEEQEIDRELLKEVAGEVAQQFGRELKNNKRSDLSQLEYFR